MALGAMTAGVGVGQDGGPVIAHQISFAGDGAYPGGGTPGFQALVRAALDKGNLEVLAVFPHGACGGYVPRYDKANDKLMVYEGNYDAADGPLQESSTANLSGVTFHLTVLCR